MKYSLRSLMMVVLVLPPLLAGAVWLVRLVNHAPWRNVMRDPLNGIDIDDLSLSDLPNSSATAQTLPSRDP